MGLPKALRPLGLAVAILVSSLLLAGVLAVPIRSLPAPEGYDMPRVHLNTKNSTRFAGGTVDAVAAMVSGAVYPATGPSIAPDLIVLYAPDDWRGGLQAASLLRPLNAVLLPATMGVEAQIERLAPGGSPVLDGATVLLINDVSEVEGAVRIAADEIAGLLVQAGAPPRHAIIADAADAGTALLAAPWVAYSGDLVVFDAADAPADLPRYALGDAAAGDATRIGNADPVQTAVAFAKYEDPENPFFGWGFDTDSYTGYRAYTLARADNPAMALQSANLARRGKPGPLLWSEERQLPQLVNNYLWSQRPAFWSTPSEGPFHHFWILGDEGVISFPAQSQADYAVEIGPYQQKGAGAASLDMLSAAWIALGAASAAWIAFHEVKFLPGQSWVMRLAWPLMGLAIGPFGIPLYMLAHRRPLIRRKQMWMWDRPLWLQGLVATVSAVGFGALLMVATAYVLSFFGLPLLVFEGPLFWLGAPMVMVMIINYLVAVLISWLVFQTPMLAMFHGRTYTDMLLPALPIVLASMAAAALAMFPGMWWLMMWDLPMMPAEESILWFGVMFFTVFLALLMAWPFNYLFVRRYQKSGLM